MPGSSITCDCGDTRVDGGPQVGLRWEVVLHETG
jgi:hypothetical protein